LPAAVVSSQARDARLVTLLRTLTLATELPLRVATYAYAEPGSPNVRVVVTAEADARPGMQEGAASVLLGFVLIDARGVIAATAGREAVGRYAFSAVVPPGRYTLRVGAIDPLGRQGSVERSFDARITVADGVRVSDLILAPVPSQADEPLEPVIDRVTSPAIIAYLEMHAEARRRLPDAVRIVVTADNAPSVSGEELVTVPAEVTKKDGTWAIARAVVPTDGLRPGRYIAHAEVVTDGRTITRVARPFTIAAR
jgi:hypothetical protein